MSDLVVVCGFYGTICEQVPDYCLDQKGNMKSYCAMPPIYSTIRMLNGFQKSGCIVAIVDNNLRQHKDAIKTWLKDHGVTFDLLIMAEPSEQLNLPHATKLTLVNKYVEPLGKIFCCVDNDASFCRNMSLLTSRPNIYTLSRREL